MLCLLNWRRPFAIVTLLIAFMGDIHPTLAQQSQKLTGGDYVVGPDYRTDPDLTDKGNPKGKSFEFLDGAGRQQYLSGNDSTLDSRKEVRKERKIYVYVPAAYKDGDKASLLVIHDGPAQLPLVRNALTT